MTPLYSSPRALVYCCDWREITPLLTSVGCTITDPPFTEHVQKNIRSVNTRGGKQARVKKWEPGFEPLSDMDHVPALLEVTERWLLCCCALEQFGVYAEAAGGQRRSKPAAMRRGNYIRSWVWRKQQAAPQLSGDRPANSCEGIAVMHAPGKCRWNGCGGHAWSDLDRPETIESDTPVDNCCIFGRNRGEKRHPTQKPNALCDHLVAKFTEPDELIFDPYCGSGAIAAAALRAGRRVLACDVEPKWAQCTADWLREIES